MILLIDNYDSFTYNLYQYIGIFNSDIKVVRNDKITIEEIKAMTRSGSCFHRDQRIRRKQASAWMLSKNLQKKKPILGICLGHQCIGEALGGTVSYAKALFHGKQSLIEHDGSSVFTGINSPIRVARYHSLAVQEKDLPDCLRVLAEPMTERLWQCAIRNIRLWDYSSIRNPFIPSTANASSKIFVNGTC